MNSFSYSESLGLGRPATENEVVAWDIDIRPDGSGLPIGSGSVLIGEEVYTDNCASCHGDFGEGIDRWPELAGGFDTLDSENPVKTIGSYWPYLSTVWDYVHRAMPFGNAQSLSNDEVYSITAYIMYLNDLVDEDFELSNLNFEEVRLPNEQNFYQDNREDLENVIKASEIFFGKSNFKDLNEISEDVFLEIFEDVPSVKISKPDYDSIPNFEKFLQVTGFFKSNSDIRRSIGENSVMINKERVNDDFDFKSISLIKKKYILLQRGKKNYFLVNIN